MKGSSFEQLSVLKKKNVLIIIFFTIYGHDSQWSVTIGTNSQSRFNSRIDVKFGEKSTKWFQKSKEMIGEEYFNCMLPRVLHDLYLFTVPGKK